MVKVEELRGHLGDRAVGRASNEERFRELREDLRADPLVGPLLPEWLRTVRTFDDWWAYIKPLFATYADRQAFLAREFDPVLTYLEDYSPEDQKPLPRRTAPPTKDGPFAGVGDGLADAYQSMMRPRLEHRPAFGVSQPITVKGPPAPSPEPVRVFVVHGHDHGPRDSVARLLERLGMLAVILEEQPDRGLQTVIEKFEEHANVRYAVIVLTPDDVGGVKDSAGMKPRARQNVILELGFFIGKLGRDKVSAILVDDVEEPSDIRGGLYISFDRDGAWKMKLARNMRAAGLPVDMNLIA